MKKRLLCLFLFGICNLCFLTLFSASNLLAQGSADDYRRAGNLRGMYADKVFKTNIQPEWFSEGERFWYKNRLSGDRSEFVMIDAKNGTRHPAFDHEKLATALSKQLGREISHDKLPIRTIFPDEEGDGIGFMVDSNTFKYDSAKNEIEKIEGAEHFAGDELRPLQRRVASAGTDAETEILFENKLEKPLKLYWVDSVNNEAAYGEIAAGASRSQHTYEGHVWILKDAENNIEGIYMAESRPRRAVVPATPNRQQMPQQRPSREGGRPNQMRSDSAVSPDGKYRAFIRDYNVFVRPLEGGDETRLSSDGSGNDRYEEPFYWSPDSKKLVAKKTLQGDSRRVYYVEAAPRDQLQPKLHDYHYLKPGDRIPLSKPHLFALDPMREIPVSDELFPNPWSVSQIRWDADSTRFFFHYNQRGHQIMRYIAVNAESGETTAVINEECATFFDYNSKFFFRFFEETNEIIWMSERDGWNHLYLIDAKSGEVKNQITSGNWVVRRIENIDPETRTIRFFAGGIIPEQDPYYLHFCTVKFGGDDLKVLTEGDGTHFVQISPNGKYFIDTYSRVDLPPVHELRDMESGKLICPLEMADHSELLKAGWVVPERFKAKGRDGETDIYGVIIRPRNLDTDRSYSVIEDIYAGPHDSFVPKSFSSYFSMNSMAELGFILVKIDGMGTNNRSKAFHDVCWKNLGDSGFPDRILWIKEAAKKYPEMDISKVGIFGGSAGGQSSLRALLAHGDFYKVAVSDCGCHDNRMDKIWWNELWMSWPLGPHYAEQSNVTQAHRLQGKLLLIVGEKDENVDPASTIQVADALIRAEKDFELLLMTGVGHGAAETPYGSRRRMDFFVRHLLDREPRWK